MFPIANQMIFYGSSCNSSPIITKRLESNKFRFKRRGEGHEIVTKGSSAAQTISKTSTCRCRKPKTRNDRSQADQLENYCSNNEFRMMAMNFFRNYTNGSNTLSNHTLLKNKLWMIIYEPPLYYQQS